MGAETLRDAFEESFHRYGKKRAVTFVRNGVVETEISYEALGKDANRMAHTLIDMGVGKGERVILFFPKSLMLVVAHLALQQIGAIAVPLNPDFKKSEMAYFLADAEPKAVLCGRDQEAMIREIAPALKRVVIPSEEPYQGIDFFRSAPDLQPRVHIDADNLGLIIYTSGTTGNPKGAVLTHRNLIHDAKNIIKIWEITTHDVLCHALPLFHVHGLCFALYTALLAGAGVVLFDRFVPEIVLKVLTEKKGNNTCTLFMAVPAMYTRLMDTLGEKRFDFDHVRLWTSGSAPLLVKEFERIENIFGKEPVEREGMSESGMNFSNPLKGKRKPGSIGIPLPKLDVRIVDPYTMADVSPGQIGEIWIKSPAVTPGYWRKPEDTAAAFVQGWFRTGDLGKIDEDGYYYLTDRIKHIIITGGENVSAKEVETIINQVDGVIESAVVGIPDEKWGEKVVAAVVKKPEQALKVEDIQAFCKERLLNWKCPKEVIFVDELPKNTMGKILKEKINVLFIR